MMARPSFTRLSTWLVLVLALVSTTAAVPILDSILNPLESALGALLKGQGLVTGVLGVLQGALGVEQTWVLSSPA
jgi:hypothetical protein